MPLRPPAVAGPEAAPAAVAPRRPAPPTRAEPIIKPHEPRTHQVDEASRARPSQLRSSVGRVPALDGFRAYAILGVVAIHILGMSGALEAARGTAFSTVAFGALGNVIDAFFIITGFLLFLPTVLNRGRFGSIRSYAIGRAARLLPAYWLSLGVVLVLIAVVPPSLATGFPSLSSIGLHVGALQMPARLFDGTLAVGFGVNGPVWMISVIVGFYVVLPFLARPYLRHPLAGLALAALVTVVWKEGIVATDGLLRALDGSQMPGPILRLIAVDQLPGWAFSFALGMTGAWAYVRLHDRGAAGPRLERRALVVGAGALIVYTGFAYLYGRYASTVSPMMAGSHARGDSLVSLGSSASRAVLMGAIALGPLWLRRPFANGPVRRVGESSYGLYLIHVPIGLYAAALLALPTDGSARTVALWSAVVVPASLIYAEVSRRLVERPIRRRARALERRLMAVPREGVVAGGGLAVAAAGGDGRRSS